MVVDKITRRDYNYTGYTKRITLYKNNSSIFSMFDILGFGEYVTNNDSDKVYDDMMHVLGNLIIVDNMRYRDLLKGKENIFKAVSSDWVDNFKIGCKLISDTIILYPEIEKIESIDQYGFCLNIISVMTNVFYRDMLEKNELFMRGIIIDGEFAYTKDYSLILGKSIIEAYHYEKMQKWSGIIYHPRIIKVLMKNDSFKPDDIIKYNELPLKKNGTSKSYRHEIKKINAEPYVMDWVSKLIKKGNKLDEEFWLEHVDRIENMKVNKEKKDLAKEKIINTKNFYNYVIHCSVKKS